MFQSTRPVWGATASMRCMMARVMVSIHAPRVGRDRSKRPCVGATISFNPRAPCGARPRAPIRIIAARRFQSTRPVWGATSIPEYKEGMYEFQSTRPVWGATAGYRIVMHVHDVSIHAPRVGRDHSPTLPRKGQGCFNPRAPCGARRHASASACLTYGVSFHAPRVGRAQVPCCSPSSSDRFNPRAPCGARQRASAASRAHPSFNPRAPCGARLCRSYSSRDSC